MVEKHAAEFHKGQCRVKHPPPPKIRTYTRFLNRLPRHPLLLETMSTTHTICPYPEGEHRLSPVHSADSSLKKGLCISARKGHACKSCNTGNRLSDRLCSTGLLLIKLLLMNTLCAGPWSDSLEYKMKSSTSTHGDPDKDRTHHSPQHSLTATITSLRNCFEVFR